jgi:hypothetical protein
MGKVTARDGGGIPQFPQMRHVQHRSRTGTGIDGLTAINDWSRLAA